MVVKILMMTILAMTALFQVSRIQANHLIFKAVMSLMMRMIVLVLRMMVMMVMMVMMSLMILMMTMMGMTTLFQVSCIQANHLILKIVMSLVMRMLRLRMLSNK